MDETQIDEELGCIYQFMKMEKYGDMSNFLQIYEIFDTDVPPNDIAEAEKRINDLLGDEALSKSHVFIVHGDGEKATIYKLCRMVHLGSLPISGEEKTAILTYARAYMKKRRFVETKQLFQELENLGKK